MHNQLVGPVEYDEYYTPTCHLCERNATIKVRGTDNCGECGNEIDLCKDHAAQLVRELLGTGVEP